MIDTVALKLHLGCGKRFIPGFVHVDLANDSHIQHQVNVDWLPMFEDESVGLIYSSHVLEHFTRQKAMNVLREWYRILTPGGILRLAVPDLEALVVLYNHTHDLKLLLGSLYGRGVAGDRHSFHRTGFDFELLRSVLEEVNFVNVHRYDWRETEHADVDDFSQAYYPHMDKEHGQLLSLNVEATK